MLPAVMPGNRQNRGALPHRDRVQPTLLGIADAYMDSTPLVAITGQVSSDLIGRDVFRRRI